MYKNNYLLVFIRRGAADSRVDIFFKTQNTYYISIDIATKTFALVYFAISICVSEKKVAFA